MKFNAAAAREFANNLGYMDGAGPEVRLWLHSAIDAADAAQQDAARYRWLREGNFMPMDLCGCCQMMGADLDSAIDSEKTKANAEAAQ